MLVNVGQLSDKFTLKDNILDLMSDRLVLPRTQVQGERGRPPLTIQEKKDRADEGLQWKKRANIAHKTLGKRAVNRAIVKKASNLAAARKDRLKKEEEKIILVTILTEIRKISD